ncbi:MAG: T9SS type A sorting domain-containing protein, partial [Bacteroidales bacterium]|nr:T9SS type A sorting domain-containing protein [Bacteroidales bacterium]
MKKKYHKLHLSKAVVLLLLAVNSVFTAEAQSSNNSISININCIGNGQVQKTRSYDGNRCGMTDRYVQGFYASYDFLPDDDSELSHLYVNNVDRINDVYTNYSGSSGVVHTFRFVVGSANSISSSISLNPVFTLRSSNRIPVNINCTGNGQVQKTRSYDGDRCGMTDYYSEGFYTSYDFLPDDDSELSHLYVNNVDRINDVYTNYSGSSGVVHSFGFVVSSANSISSSISINPVFAPRNYNGISVDINCTGNGQVQKSHFYDGNRCGMIDYYSEGLYTSYDFLPDDDSELTHLYVNNVDRINDVYTNYSGSSGVVHSFEFVVSSAISISSSISINPVFTLRNYEISAYSANTSMGYVTGGGEYAVGTTAILSAIPYYGFIFDHWNDNNTENPRYVTVEDNAEYVAHFVERDGIDIVDSYINFTLFPNPTSEYTDILLSGTYGTVSVSVVDLHGRLIASKHFSSYDDNCVTRLDIKDFSPGIYFVYIRTLDGNLSV